MKIFNASQLHDLDLATTQEEGGKTSLELMETAAACVTRHICERWQAETWRVIVFAGAGNNGGDALTVARQLAEKNYDVSVFLFNTRGHLSTDCEANRQRLLQVPTVEVTEVKAQFEAPAVDDHTLIVDGLFGTGLNKPLSGGFASLVKFINATPAKKVAIDMPSGLMAEDNTLNVRNHIVRADLTVTFHSPKLSQLLADCSEFAGELVVEDIGLSKAKDEDTLTDCHLTELADVRPLLKSRETFGHKGTFGHALLVAGSGGMAGAALLAAKACLRSGVGKVTIHTPERCAPVLQTALPEAVLSIDQNADHYSHTIATDDFQAIGIGPGLGTHGDSAVAFIEQVRHARASLLIDADGINILAGHKGWMQQIPPGTILTPHPGEMLYLGTRGESASFTLLSEAREMAEKHDIFIVLKGRFTAICTPKGTVHFNPTGNCGMATAGSGDVLTGIILALLARRYKPFDACQLGVYLHGLAGDIAARKLGEESLIASDIIAALPEAFAALRSAEVPTERPASLSLYKIQTP